MYKLLFLFCLWAHSALSNSQHLNASLRHHVSAKKCEIELTSLGVFEFPLPDSTEVIEYWWTQTESTYVVSTDVQIGDRPPLSLQRERIDTPFIPGIGAPTSSDDLSVTLYQHEARTWIRITISAPYDIGSSERHTRSITFPTRVKRGSWRHYLRTGNDFNLGIDMPTRLSLQSQTTAFFSDWLNFVFLSPMELTEGELHVLERSLSVHTHYSLPEFHFNGRTLSLRWPRQHTRIDLTGVYLGP